MYLSVVVDKDSMKETNHQLSLALEAIRTRISTKMSIRKPGGGKEYSDQLKNVLYRHKLYRLQHQECTNLKFRFKLLTRKEILTLRGLLQCSSQVLRETHMMK